MLSICGGISCTYRFSALRGLVLCRRSLDLQTDRRLRETWMSCRLLFRKISKENNDRCYFLASGIQDKNVKTFGTALYHDWSPSTLLQASYSYISVKIACAIRYLLQRLWCTKTEWLDPRKTFYIVTGRADWISFSPYPESDSLVQHTKLGPPIT